MVLTTAELITALQHEVHILLHLAGKVEGTAIDYRPTPGQRSMIELFRYMSFMGPEITKAILGNGFDPAAWTAAEQRAASMDLKQVCAAIGAQKDVYAELLSAVPEAVLRSEADMFGQTESRGSHLVNMVLCGYAAYRTQLFVYLKACGHAELSTYDLWAGMDAPAKG